MPLRRPAILVFLVLGLLAPAFGEPLAGTPLPLTVRVLDNGLTVAVVENHTVPLVTIEAAVRNGSMNEPPRWNGLSHLWEHMFFKGNARIPDQEAYLRRARELGMIWNGTTGTERVNYFFTLPAANLRPGLQFMSDALRSPRFEAAEFEREKEVVLGEFDRNEALPAYHLHRALRRSLWGDLANRKDPLGSREAIRAATTADMAEMQRLYYVPENTLLVVAGDVQPTRAVALAREVFGSWPRSGAAPAEGVEFPALTCSKAVRVEQPVQTVVLSLNWVGPDTAGDLPGTLAADVFLFLVGQRDSALQKSLVDGGLAESVDMGYQTQRRGGQISLTMVTDPARARPALRAALAQVARAADRDFYTPAQLVNARTLLAVQDLYSREVAHDFAHTISFWWAVADLDYYRQYLPRLNQVSEADLQRFAQRYLVGRPVILAVMAGAEGLASGGLTQEVLEQELRQAGLEVCP